jgi:glycosyltransferase involved in cell wall biosynthesis
MSENHATHAPLHVLHLTLGADAGGLSRYAIDLATAMQARGHRCTIAGDDGAWRWAFADARLDYLQIPLKRGALGFLRSVHALRAWMRQNPVHLLHTHYRRATLLGRRLQAIAPPAEPTSDPTASAPARRPLLYTLHLSHLSLAFPRRLLTDFGDHTHVASADARDWLVNDASVPESRVTLIPHGVDLRRYHPPTPEQRLQARTRLGLAAADRVAIFVGRLDHPKNEDWLLDLDDAAVRAGLDLKIVLVGEGPHEATLRRRIEHEGRGRRVQLVGHQNPLPYYLSADALLLPSLREGFSLVCAEAMACGVPCLRTRTSGCHELIVEDVTGRSTPIDREAFVAAAVEFLGDLDTLRRLGRSAREHVAARFGFDQQVDSTLALYRRLLHPAPR